MFGYVRPVRDELRMIDYDRYHAAYCGLCRRLGKRFGFFSRFLVNYDLTFLYLLLASVEERKPIGSCRCPARLGCRKKACIEDDALLDYVAAVDVILCRQKIADDILDSGFWKAAAFRLVRLATARGYKRAKAQLPAFDETVRTQLQTLQDLEQAHSGSIDATADSFAKILSACAMRFESDTIRRPMEQLLYHVGRYIYLIDALDDLPEDCRTEGYNPLRYRFPVEDGALPEADAAYFREILNGSVNLAGAAFELLEHRAYQKLLENIIYLGLPTVLKAVEHGDFRQQAKL